MLIVIEWSTLTKKGFLYLFCPETTRNTLNQQSSSNHFSFSVHLMNWNGSDAQFTHNAICQQLPELKYYGNETGHFCDKYSYRHLHSNRLIHVSEMNEIVQAMCTGGGRFISPRIADRMR